MARGGKRSGAGRPKGTGKYGEPTIPVRVPVRLANAVADWVATGDSSGGPGVPLYGATVRAGGPTAADDYVEDHVNLHEYLVANPNMTFLVRVQGDSMIDVGMQDGDLLVVDRSLPAMEGKIVVASVDGDLTVKTLHRKGKLVELHPANPSYEVIKVGPEQTLQIMGVVTTVVHSV